MGVSSPHENVLRVLDLAQLFDLADAVGPSLSAGVLIDGLEQLRQLLHLLVVVVARLVVRVELKALANFAVTRSIQRRLNEGHVGCYHHRITFTSSQTANMDRTYSGCNESRCSRYGRSRNHAKHARIREKIHSNLSINDTGHIRLRLDSGKTVRVVCGDVDAISERIVPVAIYRTTNWAIRNYLMKTKYRYRL